MTDKHLDNPITKGKKPVRGSVYTAAEYAARADADGRHDLAKQWWDASRDGWDEDNYDPVAAAEHKRQIEVKRGKAWSRR